MTPNSTNSTRLEVPGQTQAPTRRPNLIHKTTTSQRLPPPSLFQAPPSQNASHISLALPNAPPTSSHSPPSAPRASRIPPASSFAGSLNATRSTNPQAQNATSNAERADALWAEMQNTLAEVELSAMNSSQVFGASHAKALEDLRTSQLALAQAWAKSEADEMGDPRNDFDAASPVVGVRELGSPKAGKKGEKENDKRGNLEEETEKDILLARKRREANDRYFQQVNSGVLDVVGKLEEVAAAMRRAETQSREIWSESESGGSVTDGTEMDATGLTASPG